MSMSFMGGMQDNANITSNSMNYAMTVGQATGYNPYAMIIAGVVGGVAGGFKNMAQYKQQAAEYTATAESLEAQVKQMQLQNEQIQYYLDNYQNYYDQSMGQQYLQGRQSYDSMAGGLSDQLVAAASSGHLGGSSGIIAEQAENDLRYMFGDDMSMGGTDGLYGQAVVQLKKDLANEKQYQEKAYDLNVSTISDLSDAASEYRSKARQAKNDSKDYGKQIVSALTGGLFG